MQFAKLSHQSKPCGTDAEDNRLVQVDRRVFIKTKRSIVFSLTIAVTIFLAIFHCTNSLAMDKGVKEGVHQSTSTPEGTFENKEQQQQQIAPNSIQSHLGKDFRDILLLMNEIADMATKFKTDFEDVKVQVQNIKGQMMVLNQEVKELKSEIAELNTSQCGREDSLFLEILTKLFPKIRLEVFAMPLLNLRQFFSL
ncbi:hypothetical protein XELAEV_18026797mg [Xenopus laevis]|uniref:Uncharacterized protein n=1 Tax=Xenopus laevis TaxID=8355 RepID=A0A974HJ28_XENLA|nr:hypothetical protein XELAEV_18026797mg [Xenopus laevis]